MRSISHPSKTLIDVAKCVDSPEIAASGIEDIKQTEKLKDASDLLDITLIDHIIVGDQNYFSFAENKETCK